MTMPKKWIWLGLSAGALVAAAMALWRGEPTPPFQLRFLYLTNDAMKGPAAVFEVEHRLFYNISGSGKYFLRQGSGAEPSQFSPVSLSLQLPPGQTTRFQIPPPSNGTWRLCLHLGLPDNPGLKEHRPLKIKIIDAVDSLFHWAPVPPSWKARSYHWSDRSREVWSQPFEIPPPPDPRSLRS